MENEEAETVELAEAMRRAANLSLNGRTWADAMRFQQISIAVRKHMGWDFDEWTQQLEAAKAGQAEGQP